jgi:hypothetical protein
VKLSVWLKANSPERREAVAAYAGTNVNYLYQLATKKKLQLKAQIAQRLETATRGDLRAGDLSPACRVCPYYKKGQKEARIKLKNKIVSESK